MTATAATAVTVPTAAGPAGAPGSSRCPHCGTAVEGERDVFCCAGCEMADAIIRGAGLERYYVDRDEFAPRPEGRASAAWATVPVESHDDGTCEVRLRIEGLRCASCVWVTENVLARTPGVREARVSYATGRATLRWNATEVELPQLAGTISALGYRPRLLGEETRPDRDLMLRLGVAVFGAMNVMGISAAIYAGWFGPTLMQPRFAALFDWITLALATPVALWSAAPFFRGAISGLRHRVLHMDLPIALAIGVLYGHGLLAVLGSSAIGVPLGLVPGQFGAAYLDSLTMLVALLLAGRLLEGRGRRRAAEAAVSLAAVLPPTARRIEADGSVRVVSSHELEVGDRVAVGAGEELPADGVVDSGHGLVRQALLTGEAEPVAVGAGARVFAGTLLEDGALQLAVSTPSETTLIQRMAEQLRSAADRPVRPTTADRLAPWFTAITLAVALSTFVAWLLLADGGTALRTTVAVLVVACPCALALSHPLAAAAGLGAAARRGLLLRSSDALLDLAEVDVVALDKTGTVTGGTMEILEADDATLRIAAGLERWSLHPIARAIVAEAAGRGIALPEADEVEEVAGKGIRGRVDGREWWLERGAPGHVDLVADDGERKPIRLGDELRSDSADTVRALQALGCEVVLLTGDHADTAATMAERAGISLVHAELSPEDKVGWIRERQALGERVVFVGDGLNDGPALSAADVGIAMGSGAASSILAADGVLATASLAPVPRAGRTARRARRAIRANLIRSLTYNVAAVGAAAAGWVNPLVAAVLMPLSSAMVVWGASRVGGES